MTDNHDHDRDDWNENNSDREKYDALVKKLAEFQKNPQAMEELTPEEVIEMLQQATVLLSKNAVPVANQLQVVLRKNGFKSQPELAMALHMVAFSLYPTSVLFAEKPKGLPADAPDPTLYMCEVARDLAREHYKRHQAQKVEESLTKLIKQSAERAAKIAEEPHGVMELDLNSLPTDDKKH